MARPTSFAPKQTETKSGKRWVLNVPARFSETGKRQRLFFKTRQAAFAERNKRREARDEHGAKASIVKPALADEAIRATEILSPFGVSLIDAANFYKNAHDRRARSITMREAWDISLAMKEKKMREGRKGGRPRTVSDFRGWGNKLPSWFMEILVCDLTDEDIHRALDESTTSDSNWNNGFRLIRGCLNTAVKKKWTDTNPCGHVFIKDDSSHEPPVIFEAAEALETLLSEAQKRHPDTVTSFAILAFAGLRPDEMARLEWSDITLENENIRIPARKAKTNTLRNVQIEPNLQAWLSIVPRRDWERRRDYRHKTKRDNRVVPRNWRRKSREVRAAAGISGTSDIFRHSYGSYHLAAFNDLDALQRNMGHSTEKTYFNFYHRALTKREALPYWKIAPKGVKIDLTREVA